MTTTTNIRRIVRAALGFAGFLLLASSAVAQRETQAPVRANPYRDIGGSCVYGKQGEVLFAPRGARCADRTDHLDATRSASTTDRFPGLPPAFRGEANGLVTDHGHIANELDELRRAIARGKQEDALAISDELVGELREHLAREERFIGKLAAEHRAH